LKLLATIALELVSCVEARMPIPPERMEAIRAFERDLAVECSGRKEGPADAWEVGYADKVPGSRTHPCADLLE
jgi:hypothetical protein